MDHSVSTRGAQNPRDWVMNRNKGQSRHYRTFGGLEMKILGLISLSWNIGNYRRRLINDTGWQLKHKKFESSKSCLPFAPSTTVPPLYALCSLCFRLVIFVVLLFLLSLFCSSMSVAPSLNGSPLFSFFAIASSSQTRPGLVSPLHLSTGL